MTLAKQLPELLPEALEVTRQIQDESDRSRALSELAKHLPPELLPEALEVTRQIQYEYYRSRALRELAKQLPPELLPEALEIAQALQDESERSKALGELAKHLPVSLLPEVLDSISAFKNKYYCANVWQGLLHRPNEFVPSFEQFLDILEAFAYQKRDSLIDNVPKLHPALTHLGGEETLPKCLAAMREVCKQWP